MSATFLVEAALLVALVILLSIAIIKGLGEF